MSGHRITQDMHYGGTVLTDPGASGHIVVERSPCIVNMLSATAEARTLDIPTHAGDILTLHLQTDGGDITVTVTGGYNETGDTTFVFSDEGQFATFQSLQTKAGVYFWRLLSHYAIANASPTEATVLDGLTATSAEINARAAAGSRRVAVTDATTYTVLAANSGKTHVMPDFTSSCTLALPALADGLEYLFISKAVAADAQNWIFQTITNGNSFLGGLSFADTDAGSGADEIHAGVYPNGSTNDFMTIVTPAAGTRIYLICDGTNWIVNGQVFSTTVPTFTDS